MPGANSRNSGSDGDYAKYGIEGAKRHRHAVEIARE
jgi:hypothetical protein